MKQLMKLVMFAVLLAMSLFARADGNGNSGDKDPDPTNRQLQTSILAEIAKLSSKIGLLQTALTTAQTKITALESVAAKRGVAVIHVRANTAGRGTGQMAVYMYNPSYVLKGSTISGFHDAVAYDTDITSVTNNRRLPRGTYLVELQQPRRRIDDAACASGSSTECEPMRFITGDGSSRRRLFRGAGVFKFDGVQDFSIIFKMSTTTETSGRGSIVGKVKITKLE